MDAGNGASNRQNVELMTADASSVNQQWVEIDRGNGYYAYQKVGTDHCIDGGVNGAKNQNVYLWSCVEDNYNQQWQKVDVDGAVQLVKRNAPGFALNGGGGGADGQNINLWASASSSKNLQWIIEPVDSVEIDVDLLDGEEGLSPALNWRGEQYNSVTFKTVDSESVVMDIFLPDTAIGGEPVPVVIYTHGGGWVTGSQDNIGYGYKSRVADALLEAGVAVVSVDYRLAVDGTVIQEGIIDAKDAARFINKYADWYNINPQEMALFGDSAGAHIAMAAGLTDNNAEAYFGANELRSYNDFEIKGIVAWYGPVAFTNDYLGFWGGRSLNGFSERLFGDETDSNVRAQMGELVSPIYFYNTEDPYLHIVHGDMDTTINHGHLEGMSDYARANGISKFSSQTVVGAGHNFTQAGDDAINPAAGIIIDQTVEKLLSFF